MNLGSRIAAWFGGKKLPYDAEVEYLESKNADEHYTLLLPYQAECNFRFKVRLPDKKDISVYEAVIRPYPRDSSVPEVVVQNFNNQDNWGYFRVFALSGTPFPVPRNDRIVEGMFDVVNKSVMINGLPYHYGKSLGVNNSPVRIFYTGQNARLYYVEYVGKANFIPVRKGGLGYLYETISGDFYGIGGKGGVGFPAECVGPDKK